MDQLVQCPVCTLYLHNGMSLESHLDTHPKDQVIKALCSLSGSRSNYGSRASTPMNSERSYRSRSRTPANEDNSNRWSSPQISTDERYWRRTPSRTPKTSTVTRSDTPDNKSESNFDTSSNNTGSLYSNSAYPLRSVTVANNNGVSDYEQAYPYYQDQKEEKEIKYSRSAEYTSLNNTTSNVYTYNLQGTSSSVKLQNALLPPTQRGKNDVNLVPPNKKTDFIKILPKPNNIALLKTNMGSVQYISPGVMMSGGPTFVQKNSQNNIVVTANLQNPMVQTKPVGTPLSSNHYGQMANSTFAPNTTVVTQNSQIIYSEVHSVDGKNFIPGSIVNGQKNVTNVAQSSSMYQNVMVVDQFGNTSCMYTTPQKILPKQNTSQTVASLDKPIENRALIIEVSPIVASQAVDVCDASTSTSTPKPESNLEDYRPEKTETPGSTKGLKILSNIKVEVPVQHHKNLLNTVVDLTDPTECEYVSRSKSLERILPDLEITSENEFTQPSASCEGSVVSNTFSVIKNIGNPPTYKEANKVDSKLHETESSDSCPVPDLICNEKPSISPCSELSDNGDNSTSHEPVTPKPELCQETMEIKKEDVPVKTYRNNPLRLNNIFIKKHKKILHIKNAKTYAAASTSSSSCIDNAKPGSSRTSPKLPEDFTITKIHSDKEKDVTRVGRLETVSIDKIQQEQNDFDADTEEQSMDMELEPVAQSYNPSNDFAPTIDLTKVKEEVNSSNDFSNHTGISEREFTELESMRPLNVAQYGELTQDFDDDSNHRELLDLETASKNKQFVSMMNDNYFGDNIYADYFTPDRVESFDTERETGNYKEAQKDGVYLWGESSKQDSEFVLPNFIHESYKIAESSTYALNTTVMVDRDENCTDSKADVLSESRCESEAPLNICTDERMPPRGELSGQESNGDMDAPWSNGMYQEVTPSEPYDLIARESWIDEGSDIDSNEKRDHLEEELPKPRLHACVACGLQFPLMKELRAHRAEAHPPPSGSADTKPYSRVMIKSRAIKKEEKTEEAMTGMIDSKAGIATSVLQAFDTLVESKPKIEIKQEPKRRRRDYVCQTCKVDQVTDVAFHQHLKIHPLECLTCGKCFFRRANLALHIKTHLGIKNYKCEVCEKRFLTRQKLVEHHNVHSGRAPVTCPLCGAGFRRYSNMVQHRDRHHLNKKPKIRDYICHCGEIFHSRAKLRWHKETHDGKPKACQYCSDKFVHMSSLTRHVRRTHNAFFQSSDVVRKNNDNVPCPICKQVYLRLNLKTHMRTHSGKRPYVCVVCNKAFTTQWNLKLHRWTHMSRSAKPYKCTLCKGAFIRQSEYISHMNAHKSVRPYTCNYCGCQFIRKYNCQRHVREHEMAKKYVCKVPDCGKSFHRSYYLSEHMKVHSGARPFSCNICGKTSSNKSNHNKHVKIHHALTPLAAEA